MAAPPNRDLSSPSPGKTSRDIAPPSSGVRKTANGNVYVTREEVNEVTKREQNHGQLKNSSLAEIVHVYPTTGGPYHWAAILSPSHLAPIISYYTGWLACAGWITLTATTGSLAGSLVLGAYALAHPGFEAQPYQTFVIFTGFILLALLINIYLPRLLPLINSAALTWSLAGAFTIVIVCLACSGARGNDYQPARFVFGEYLNEVGWNDGVAWILGLLQSAFGLVGVDALSHMVEEIPEPHINVPRAMLLAVVVGASSSFVFLMVLLFVMTDVDAVISSSAGALLETIYQSTGNVAGSICLQVFPIVSMEFAAQGIMCAASRMVHAFARDHGLPFSKFFAHSNRSTGVPDRAVWFTAVWTIIFALIYFGSSSTFNAILSSSVVMLNLSYCVPIILLLVRGRSLLRPESFPEPTWTLGPILGPFANVVALAFTALTTVFFVFPPELPVTGSNMKCAAFLLPYSLSFPLTFCFPPPSCSPLSYAVAVLGLVLLMATLTWFLQSRKDFVGPRDLGGLLELARAEVDRGEKLPGSGRGSRSQSRQRVPIE
ncbi:hypothetical protein JCM10213v2_005444 [Rhodosporidiobolus nylandii]